MPLPKGTRYRMKHTSKGNVRLAFKGNKVIEAKNMRTGATHTAGEFAEEKKSSGKPKKTQRKKK